ncbi:MAG: hypothetical protein NVV70_02070 [Cellulomonas sp.]|nr:hypothetical protein [Cellulomonas sp.]MCR6646972.1 hypothetical protein [Cellulomonas sp.]
MSSLVKRLSGATLVCGAVLTAAALIGPSAPADEGPRPPTAEQLETLAGWVDVTPSPELDGPVLTAGTVTGAGAGVPVMAMAWPDHEALGQQQVGDSVELVMIAATLTRSDGSFELVADPVAISALTGGGETTVDFDVQVFDTGAGVAQWSTSAVLSPEIAADDSLEHPLADDITIEADAPLTVDELAAGR